MFYIMKSKLNKDIYRFSISTISIIGISGSGKTVLTYKIIENKDYIFSEKIIIVLLQWQDICHKFENELYVKFHEGIPTNENRVLVIKINILLFFWMI